MTAHDLSPLPSILGAGRTVAMRQGSVSLWRPARGIFVTAVDGHLGTDGASAVEAELRRQVTEDGRHIGFHDWGRMTGYDVAAQTQLTAAVLSQIGRVEQAHVYCRERVVVFGVRAANMVVRRLTVHEAHAEFLEALSRELARARGRP